MFLSWYDTLAKNLLADDDQSLTLLIHLARWDERAVYLIIRNEALLQKVTARLAEPVFAQFLAQNIYYPQVQAALKPHFIPIAAKLAGYEDWRVGSALADLLGSFSVPDSPHTELFTYSETYRHLILSRNLFAQRGTLKLLAFLFSDDFLQDAVSVLQYKSDILNHINRVFVDTPDFVSWRFSVRVMSLAGGYNEDRYNVEDTARLTSNVTRSLPEFVLYFTIAYVYGLFRFYPKRAKGKIPKWLRRRRAIFTGAICGALGVYSNSYSARRLEAMRNQFDLLRNQELRRRRGAERRGVEYDPNSYFDTVEPTTRRIWLRQARDYATVGGVLLLSCVQIPKLNFPAFMGDVVFNWPIMPTFFPTTVGLPCTSRSFIPYLVMPFLAASVITKALGAPIYDWYVNQRYQWWKKYRSTDVLEW